MRRTLIIALGAAAALVTAAVAVAVTTASGVSTTTATFAAGTVSDSKTRTCTGADSKTYEITYGRYTGTVDFADPNSDLDGTLTIRARTTYDVTTPATKLGYVEGSFRSRDDDSRVSGRFWGTLDKDGKMVGFLTGKSRGNHAIVLGNVSATFASTTGFADGKLGAGSSAAVLAVIAGPVCKGPRPDHRSDNRSDHKPDKPARHLSAEGVATLTGAPPTAIFVTTKHGTTPACVIPPTFVLPAVVSTVTRVEMKCELVGVGTPPTPTLTLTKLKLHP